MTGASTVGVRTPTWARTGLHLLLTGIGILVVAAVVALVAAVAASGPGWLPSRSPLASWLPGPGSDAAGWLADTAELIGLGSGPLVVAALVLRRSPAAPVGTVFGAIGVLLVPALVALTVWAPTAPR